MVPQLLPPVAATTIGTPTQKAPSDRNPAAAACGAATVFTFYFVLLAVYLALSQEWPEAHTHIQGQESMLPAGHTHARCTCAGIHQVSREKSRCQLQKWSCLVGEGKPGRLPARAASRQCAFLKTLRRAGRRASGSGYLKHLAPFISPPWKWIQLLSARANEVIWFPRAPFAF